MLTTTDITTDTVIAVDDLRVRYGATVAVDGVSLAIRRGEIFGILGPNGAGKTTTVECIGGLRAPDSGSISVLGLDPRDDRDAVRERLGIQLQSSELPDKLQVGEAMELFAAFYPDPADPAELMEMLGLTEKRTTRFANLSGGQRQRLSIALALIGRPQIAILDELTTGLDPQARRETWKLIESVRDSGVTVVLVTHFMEEAERLCDRVALLHHGRVAVIDTPAGLASGTGAGQRVSFVADGLDEKPFARLEEVAGISHHGDRITISGTGDLLATVVAELVRQRVIPRQTQVHQSTLDDAFVALTADDLQEEGR
ncbi:MAG TPA: ABC transporter ATP-binding protein [Solirubrobacteraceae bacterium]|nr:ABC transporter ATP-binding protein [Solirubrobacteraceae bacterium]